MKRKRFVKKGKRSFSGGISEDPFFANAVYNKRNNEEITSSSEFEMDAHEENFDEIDVTEKKGNKNEDVGDSGDDVNEDSEHKRLRLAKELISRVESRKKRIKDNLSFKQGESGILDHESGSDVDADDVGVALQEESFISSGLYRRYNLSKDVVDFLNKIQSNGVSFFCSDVRWRRGVPTCLCSNVVQVSSSEGDSSLSVNWKIYAAGKEGNVFSWEISSNDFVLRPNKDASSFKTFLKNRSRTDRKQKKKKVKGGRAVLAIAVSDSGNYLAYGGMDGIVYVWDFRKEDGCQEFQGHRAAISALSFRVGAENQLYSGSFDRTVKLWDVVDDCYMDTLYGHQNEIFCMNPSPGRQKERLLTCGGDNSVRLWKIEEDTQLVFRGQGGSIDCLAMITDRSFVSGGQNGSLSLWTMSKRKPVYTVPRAHGPPSVRSQIRHQQTEVSEHPLEKAAQEVQQVTANWDLPPNWITAVAAVRNSDLVVSGSSNGFLKVWKVTTRLSSLLSLLYEIPCEGFINGLSFLDSPKGNFLALAIAVGQEHRVGRWERITSARNSISIIRLL